MQDFFIFISEQWLLVSLLLALIYLFIWYESRKAGRAITAMELTRMINDDSGIVVDIRDSKEYKSGHIAGAIHLNLSDIDKRANELQRHKNKTLIVVDKLGQATGAAAKQLQTHGFTTLRLKGGMIEWTTNNLPVVKKK